MTSEEDSSSDSASFTVWVSLIVISAVSFWAQAVVTEERFVPALNVIATYFQIPDDVAGATLMAAGASSPELLTSLVALFITKSSLGMGTIVGSEIFNQLCICGGSILAARTERLALSRAIVLRETFFYGLSLALLLVALRDRHYKNYADDDAANAESNEYRYIFVQWYDAALLLGGYILYVIVCAYYDQIVEFCLNLVGHQEIKIDNPTSLPVHEDEESNVVVASMPFLRLLTREPRNNFFRPGDVPTVELSRASSSKSATSLGSANLLRDYDTLKDTPAASPEEEQQQRFSSRTCTFVIDSRKPRPSDVHGLIELKENARGGFSCFLWQQSLFYNKTRIGLNAWQLRWFTFSEDSITSVRDRFYNARMSPYPAFERVEIDQSHLVLRCYAVDEGRVYNFMAPSALILSRVVEYLGPHTIKDVEPDDSASIKSADALAVERGPSLVTYPFGAPALHQLLHVFLLPLKALLHWTVPDPRRTTAQQLEPRLRTAAISSVACVLWLVLACYAMVASLERLGTLMGVPDTVMGITVSAAGTSLPAYVASVVAARQGLGNQAVSNAFGSNSFNIFIGLGLPWALHTALYGTYSDLPDDEITTSVIILAAALLAFVVLMFLSGFVLHKWHAYLFFATYVLYLAYAIGQVFM